MLEKNLEECLNNAFKFAHENNHEFVTTEHLLLCILNNQEALNVLTFTKRRAAVEINQVLESAISNAEANYNLNASDLYISKAIANEGPTLKRFRPRARGRAGRINKRTSHLLIELESVVE